MRIERAVIRVVDLAMVAPFRTPFGVVESREVVIVELGIDDRSYFGECASLPAPAYSPDYTRGVSAVLEHHLIPATVRASPADPAALAAVMEKVIGHQMAKSGLTAAWTSWYAANQGVGLPALLGGTRARVECGISLGIPSSLDELLDRVDAGRETGFRRVKLKVTPDWLIEPVAAVRECFPDLPLTVDGNGVFDAVHLDDLTALDQLGLLYVEQPFAADELVLHARLQSRMETPVCLDESIESVGDLESALALDAGRVVNIKVGRVGGIWNAKAIHDRCHVAGVPVWCGGLMETGIGQSECLALASLPGFVLPADIAPSSRYFVEDIVEVGPMVDGSIEVPMAIMDDQFVSGEVLDRRTTSKVVVVS